MKTSLGCLFWGTTKFKSLLSCDPQLAYSWNKLSYSLSNQYLVLCELGKIFREPLQFVSKWWYFNQNEKLISKASRKFTQWRRDYIEASLTVESIWSDLERANALEASLEANKNRFKEVLIMEKQLLQKLARMEKRKKDLRENQCSWIWHHSFSIRKEEHS